MRGLAGCQFLFGSIKFLEIRPVMLTEFGSKDTNMQSLAKVRARIRPHRQAARQVLLAA
jgi:hypothetical protein